MKHLNVINIQCYWYKTFKGEAVCEFAPLAINKQAASLIGFVEIQSPGGEE